MMKTDKVEHTCTDCGKVSLLSSKWNIKRKKHPTLCGGCSHKKSQHDRKPVANNNLPKNWDEVFNDETQTANNLTEAKINKTPYYKHTCSTHGPVPYATLDNTCRLCTREQAKTRNNSNKKFNRPRVILASIKRRAKAKGLSFDLSLGEIRSAIPDICPVLNTPLSYEDENFDTSPSIDRFDSSKGYTHNNITIMSNRANRIKSDGTADEHIKIAVWMLIRSGKTSKQIVDLLADILKTVD